jgi:hypothetical protein
MILYILRPVIFTFIQTLYKHLYNLIGLQASLEYSLGYNNKLVKRILAIHY